MNNEQALQTLFNAAALAKLTAEEHAMVRKCAEQILEVIKPKDDGKVVEMPKDGKVS